MINQGKNHEANKKKKITLVLGLIPNPRYIIKNEIHSSCEIEDFVETHLCKLCVILRSRYIR